MAKDTRDPTVDAFNREVDDDLRQDQVHALWTRYGGLVIAGAIAIVLAVGGGELWRLWQANRVAGDARAFHAAMALDNAGKPAEAIDALTRLQADSTEGYRAAATLRRAALIARQGDVAGAVAAFRAAAADTSLPEAYRHAALVLAGLHGVETVDPAEMITTLAPLTASDNPWRFSALEVSALLHRRQGDTATARDMLARIADDPAAPTGARARASELLQALPPSAAPATPAAPAAPAAPR